MTTSNYLGSMCEINVFAIKNTYLGTFGHLFLISPPFYKHTAHRSLLVIDCIGWFAFNFV